MSNAYGGDTIRRLLEAYLASQQENAEAMDNMSEEELAAAELAPILTGEQMNFANAIPQYDLEGDPYSMTQQLNQLQDFNQLLADPLFQGGGGIGGWSQQAFAPTVNYEVVDSPEYQRWMNYINTPNSPEGMIAAELQGGGTPMSAIRKIQAKVLEDPEGQLAQELAMFFPALDFDGQPTGEIDWTKANTAATEIDDIRSKIPPIGGTGSLTMPDGTVVPAGEIMEVDGQLVKRTEEPSELMEHFNELGLPSPFEEYSAASFLGPEWQAQDQAWQESAAELEPYEAAMQQAYQDMLRNENWVPPSGPAPGPEAGGGGTTGRETPGAPEFVADTNWALVEGEGVPDTRSEAPADYEGGTMEEAAPLEPEAWYDWYVANANNMTDQQRNREIGRVLDMSNTAVIGGRAADMEEALRWGEVYSQIQNDMGQINPQGLGITEALEQEPNANDDLISQARDITDPTELRNFIAANPQIADDDRIFTAVEGRLDQGASGDWRGLLNDLDAGTITAAGGTGTRPQVRGLMGAQTLGTGPAGPGTKKVVRRGDLRPEQTAAIQDVMWDALARTSGEEPTPPGSTGNPDLDRALGIGQLPPVDPNAPVMNALPAGPASPAATAAAAVEPYPPVPNVPGRGVGVGDPQSAYNRMLVEQGIAERGTNRGLSGPDYLQRMATTLTGPPGSEAATSQQFMEPGYYNEWGQNSLGLYGLQPHAIGTGVTRDEYNEMLGRPTQQGWPYNAIAQGNAANIPPMDEEKAAQVARTNEFMRTGMSQDLARREFERDWIQSGRPISDMPGQSWATPPGVEYAEPRIEARDARRQQEALALMNQYLAGERTELPELPQREGPWDSSIYGADVNVPPRGSLLTPENQTAIDEYLSNLVGPSPTGGRPPQAPQAPQQPRPPAGAADDFYSAIAEYGRTGQVPTGETQEPETEDQIQQYLRNATVGGRRPDQIQQYLTNATVGGRRPIQTGETAGRTEAERRRLAQQNTDEDWEYDPTTGIVNKRTYSRNQFKRAYQQRSHALEARQRAADQIYGRGSGYGAAMAAVYRAQLSGSSPLQQVYAQRVQNVANAGIPTGAQPGLISYT